MAESGANLATDFDKIWDFYEYTESTPDSTVSSVYQEKIADALDQCEKAVHQVNHVQMFSDNEDFEEIATSDIRFLLLPAFMAHFTCKLTKGERMENIKKTQVYYRDFLRLCKNYGLTESELPILEDSEDASKNKNQKSGPPSAADMEAMTRQRQAKIERFKQQKETERKISELFKEVQKDHVDEDVKREYYTSLLHKWIYIAFDEVNSLKEEINMLNHMAKMRSEGVSVPAQPSSTTQKKPMQTFIITKSDLQKQVFGLGYPGVPTYTVDEFFDQQMAAGNIPAPGSLPKPPESERAVVEKSEVEKENKIDNDDEETLRAAREMDEYKDDHRRGWGNTHNKG